MMTKANHNHPKRPTKRKAPSSQKSQSQKQRFIETAKKLGVDESGKSFEKAFAKIVPPKKASGQKSSS